ncbi:MAG: MFS transporter [Candidatus Aegiribacteria sp.]|nr:MFS transporter [Candidatus Aegiribacteria sp.]
MSFIRDTQFYKFSAYGFLKNLRFFEPFIILYFREIGFSFLDIGILFAIREISTVFLEVPTGFVADIGGRKTSMIFSMAAYIISFLTFFFFRSYTAAASAMVLFACGEAFRTGTHKAMILEYLNLTGQQEWKPDYYGATRAASKIGSAVNALIAATLVLITGSFRYVFLAAAFPCVLNMMNLASYPSVLNGTDVEKGYARPGIKDTMRYFASVFRKSDARLSIINSATFDGFFKVLKEYLQPVLKALAIGLPVFTAMSGNRRTAIVTGLVYFVLFLAASTASRYSGRFSRRLKGVVQSINITWIIGFSMLIIAGIFQELSVYVVTIGAYLVLFVLQNLRRPLCVTYISDKVPHRIMASGLSVESLIKMLVMTVLAPVCGWVADMAGIGIAVAGAGVLMGLLYIPLRLKRPEFVVK